MHSLAARLLAVLSDAGQSPPDFLCPCQCPQQEDIQPQPGPSRLQKRIDKDRLPLRFERSGDGTYTINQAFSFHGQSVSCRVSPSGGNPTVNVDYASDDSGNAYSNDNAGPDDPAKPTPVPSPIPTISAAVDPDNMPIGWRIEPHSAYPSPVVIAASTTIASVITFLIFGLLFWRMQTWSKRKKGRSKGGGTDSDSDSSSITDVEKASGATDEDPSTAKALRQQKRAFARALARWKAKARGKAAHHIHNHNKPISPASRPSSRRTSVVDLTHHQHHPSRLSSSRRSSISDVTLPPPPDSASHSIPNSSHTTLASAASTTTPSSDTSSADSIPVVVPQPQLPPPGPAPIDDAPASPPAYRRSFQSTPQLPLSPDTAPIVPSAPAAIPPEKQPRLPPLPEHSTVASTHFDATLDQQRVSMEEHRSPPQRTEEDPPGMSAASSTRPFIHIATDDKSVLADLAARASAPTASANEDVPAVAVARPPSPHGSAPTAPEWEDVDDDVLVGPSSTTLTPDTQTPTARGAMTLPLPPPPRRLHARSLGIEMPEIGIIDYPSAPPDAYPSAPPDDSGALALMLSPSVPSAPSEEDELRDAMLALPRYER